MPTTWRGVRGTRPRGVEQGGLLKYMHDGEYHMYNPDVIATLQSAVMTGDYEQYREFAALVNGRPVSCIRDLLKLNARAAAVPIEEVEPISAIIARFDSAGMSLGRALSRGARGARHRHESFGRALEFRRRRRRSGALRHGKEFQDQAGGFRPLRRDPGIPDQCRGAADQDRAGREAGRGRAAARATRSTT